MSTDKDFIKQITKRSEDFSRWYTDVIKRAELADYSPMNNVSGLSGSVQSAKLRLYVTNASPDGGSVYLVDNNYLGTGTGWQEDGIIWDNAPVISGGPLSAAGAVSLDTWVELDVTAAIVGDGIYSFGMSSSSTNSVFYSSTEGTNPPELVVSVN